jgi:hypothetical protein
MAIGLAVVCAGCMVTAVRRLAALTRAVKASRH